MKGLDPMVRAFPPGILRNRRDSALEKAAAAQGDERAEHLARALVYEAELLRRAEAELKQLRGGKVVKT